MGRKKTSLEKGDRYAALVVANRAIAVLGDALVGSQTDVELCREHVSIREFDDLVERVGSHRGLVGWQIRHREVVHPADVVAMLRALDNQGDTLRGLLAIPEWADVRSIGALRHVASVCNQLRAATPRSDLFDALTQKERKTIGAIQDAVGIDRDRTTALLRRFDVRVMGSLEDVRADLDRKLGAIFGSANHGPTISVLLDHLESLDGTIWFTFKDLLDGPLSALGAPASPLEPIVGKDGVRARFLRRVTQAWNNYWPLGGDDVDARVGVHRAFVSRELSMEARGGDAEVRLTTDQLVSRVFGGEDIVVLGDVGAGKSTWLVATASAIAQTAMTHGTSPLPLLVHARDLVGTAWHNVVASTLDRDAALATLATHWVLLVDGVDEVGPQVWSLLRQTRASAPSVVGILAVSRSVASPDPADGFRVMRLVDWSAVDAERFLVLWSQIDQVAVDTVRRQLAVSSELLQNPLLATIAVLLAKGGGVLPQSRSALVAQACEHLFHHWRKRRPERSDVPWGAVQELLTELAYDFLCGLKLDVPRVTSALAKHGLQNATALLKEAERQLGLLVRRGQYFDFVFRAAAEYLAARQIREQDYVPIAELAKRGWAHEPIRHAIGLEFLEGSKPNAERLLKRLSGSDRVSERFTSPRPLSVCLDVVFDLSASGGSLSEDARRSIIGQTVAVLFDEESTWIGEHLVRSVQRIAAIGGAFWEELFNQIVVRAWPKGRPRDWWAGQKFVNQETWLRLLLHRDCGVRALAIRRLAEDAPPDKPPLDALRLIICDGGSSEFHINREPALVAGMILRTIPDQYRSPDLLAELRHLARDGGQLVGGAAAIALHANECDSDIRIRALATLGQGYGLPPDVVEELRVDVSLGKAMDNAWPKWREKNSWGEEREGTVDLDAATPPSRHVRYRVARACGPALARLGPDERERVTADVSVHAVAEIVSHSPEWPGLFEHKLGELPLEDQRALGRFALREPSIAQRLIEKWPGENSGTLYPGAALEPLIEAGSEAAANVYAAWLHRSPYFNGLTRPSSPAAVVQRSPVVCSAICKFVEGMLHRVMVGDAQGIRTASVSAAHVLVTLPAAWEGNAEIVAKIFEMGDPEHEFHALLIATETAHLADERLRATVERVRDLLRRVPLANDRQINYTAYYAIVWSETQGVLGEILTELRELAALDGLRAWQAIGALWPFMDASERFHSSAAMATRAMSASPGLQLRYCDRFVIANPDAWYAAARDVIAANVAPPAEYFIRILRVLPRDLRTALVRVFCSSPMATEELPWLGSGYWDSRTNSHEYFRLADLARRLSFEHDVEPTSK